MRFTIETYNAFDRGRPEPADIIAIQERPTQDSLRAALPHHRMLYPIRSHLALMWDPGVWLDVTARTVEVYKSGREHGRPGTTPRGYIIVAAGTLAGRKVAVINAHLVNNAFGPVKRGERALRLRLWWQGWRAINAAALALRLRGFHVFRVGDLNRRALNWQGEGHRAIGKGYDRIRYPRGVELLEAWRGKRAGSDHAPLLARFRFTKGARTSN